MTFNLYQRFFVAVLLISSWANATSSTNASTSNAKATTQNATDVDVRHYVVQMEIFGKDPSRQYSPMLAKLILNASKAKNEVIDFEYSDHRYSQERSIRELERDDNGNRLLAVTTSKSREQQLHPIRIPLYKGLLGIRALVIRKEDNEKFAQIRRKQELETLVAGQGINWISTKILQDNKLPVAQAATTNALYNLLNTKHIDYLPRGIIELFFEREKISNFNLLVNDNLLLYSPLPMYFFVRKNNTELATRIENGFRIILKNGEFEKFFLSDPNVAYAIQELKKHKRHVIHLKNIELPEETPLDQSEYWFNLSSYEKQEKVNFLLSFKKEI